jgi:hypothetical protein
VPEGARSALRVVELAEIMAEPFCTHDEAHPCGRWPGLYSTVAKEDMQCTVASYLGQHNKEMLSSLMGCQPRRLLA